VVLELISVLIFCIMAMMDNQEYSFLLWVKEIEMRYTELPKDQRIRVERWLDKLVGIDTNYEFVKERNMYAKLLLDMVFVKKLSFPFHTAPPEGSLPRFPNHLRLSLKNTVGAHETQFWRELYKRVVAANNPSLEDVYERNVAHTAEVEAELFELKNKSEIQESKIQELLTSNISLEKTKTELSTELTRSKEQIDELQLRLTAEEESVRQLDEELSEYKEKVLDLADKVDSETEMNQTLSLHIDEDQQQLEEITELLAGEVAENKILQAGLREAEAVEKVLRKELAEQSAAVSELQSVVAERNGRVEALNSVMSSQKEASQVLQTLLEGCRQHEEELRERVEGLEAARGGLEKQVVDLTDRHERLQVDAKRDRDVHEERVTALERKIFEGERGLRESEKAVAACRRDLESTLFLAEERGQQLDECRRALQKAQQHAEDCQMEFEKRQKEMRAEIASLAESLAATRSELEQCRTERKAQVTSMEQSAVERQKEFDRSRDELRETVADLRHALKEQEARHEARLRKEQEKVATLEERLGETINCSADIHQDYNDKIASYERTIIEREREIDTVLEHAADIKKMLYESEHFRSLLMSELDDMKVELESKGRELKEAREVLRSEEEKSEMLGTQVQLLQQDSDRSGTQKSADVISRFKLERALSQHADRVAELEKEVKFHHRLNEELKMKLASSEANSQALTIRVNEISKVAAQRSHAIDDLETKLLRAETARTESLNSCLKLAKENQMIERRYEDLYYAFKDTESRKDSLRNSLMVLEDAREKSVHNLEDMIQCAFQDMMDNSDISSQRRVK
jgi:chromosome segregation ATPase